jgi:hypothetical protein
MNLRHLTLLVRFALVWRRHPSWRFTQLVVNVADLNDPFYVEDEQFVRNLKEWKL